jgi:hypothetical protein
LANSLDTVTARALVHKPECHFGDFSAELETMFSRPDEKSKYLQKSVDSLFPMFFTEVAGGD